MTAQSRSAPNTARLALGSARPDRTIRQLEFELEKAEHGTALPYDAEHVGQLRKMLVEARKRKLSAGLKARREQGRR